MKSIKETILFPIQKNYKNFSSVSLDESEIDLLAKEIKGIKPSTWQSDFILKSGNFDKTFNYFLIFSALSFYYWKLPKWHLKYNGEILGGSESMFYFLTKSIETGNDFTDTSFIESLSLNQFRKLITGEDSIQISMIEKRYRILKEIGTVLDAKYNGSFYSLCSQLNFDASKIVFELIDNFESFQDTYVTDNGDYHFWKKAQESVTLIAESHVSKGISFNNLHDLTASSDYKLPQILSAFGILNYTSNVRNKILRNVNFEDRTVFVIELRAATIIAVELLASKVSLDSYEVSNLLWTLSQRKTKNMLPYPKIISNII
jgi:hypothetical protein